MHFQERMFESVKAEWQRLKELPPGNRFETTYHRKKKENAGKSPFKRIAMIGIAIVSFAIGVVLAFIPGPAILFFAITASILATQSLHVAKALDKVEVYVRKLIRRWKRARAS
jgi:hypothetical protein